MPPASAWPPPCSSGSPSSTPRLADTPLLARLVSGSYPVFDVVVVAMMLWLLLAPGRWSPTMVLLVSGRPSTCRRSCLLGADRPGDHRRPEPQLARHALVDRLRAVPARRHASVRPAPRPGRRPMTIAPISRGRLALSGLTLLAPIVALGIAGTELSHLLVAVGAEVVLVVLVLLRLSDLAAGEQGPPGGARPGALLPVPRAELLGGHGGARRRRCRPDASPAVRTLLAVAPPTWSATGPERRCPASTDRAVSRWSASRSDPRRGDHR